MKFLKILLFMVLLSNCMQPKGEKELPYLQEIISTFEAYEGYDKKAYPLGLFTEEYFRAESEFASKRIQELDKLNISKLNETDQISAALLRYILQEKIDFYEYERYLNPLLSDSGFHASLPYMVRPLTNYKQTKEYLAKLNALPQFVDQHFENLRKGLAKGVGQPGVIFKGYESSYNDHIVADYKKSYFYSPFKSLPKTLNKFQRDSVLAEAQKSIQKVVIPQFERIKLFFEKEYLPNTRHTVGISDTPGGTDYYQNRINYYTTSKGYTADSIHNIGKREVARIRASMEGIIRDLEFKGSFADFLNFPKDR